MDTLTKPAPSQTRPGNSSEWAALLPEGAVSVEAAGPTVVLRASRALQQRFEELLERHKEGTLTAEEARQYQAICELDEELSWLNRLARGGRGA